MRSTLVKGVSAKGILVLIGAGSLLSGCATLPSNGPAGRQVVKEAQKASSLEMTVVDVAPSNIARLEQPDGSSVLGLSQLARTAPLDRIGVGDVLAIQIFEVGAGLFTGGRISLGQGESLGTPTASAEKLGGGIMVGQDGTISVPYVGRIAVAGLTAAEVENKIVAGLRGKSQSPQVMVDVQQNVSNAIYVSGAVARPGRQILSLANVRILDAIADAGGYSTVTVTGASTATGTGPQDFVIRMTRDGHTVEEDLDAINSGGLDDLLLVPGDRIELLHRPKTFVVLGATDKVAQMPFESRVLSLAEALGRIGGPADARADPRYVFIFRDNPTNQPRTVVSPLVAPAMQAGPEDAQKAVIYRLNMMHATSYFLAQRFAMRDKDVVYISNAPANQPQKMAQILGLLFSPFFSLRAAAQ